MPKSKNDSGVRQLKNGFWAYRFSISVGGRAINQRGSAGLDGNILRTKQDAIKARKKAIKMAQLAPLLPEKKPEPIKLTYKTMADFITVKEEENAPAMHDDRTVTKPEGQKEE